MEETTKVHAGLDVHKESIAIGVAEPASFARRVPLLVTKSGLFRSADPARAARRWAVLSADVSQPGGGADGLAEFPA